jgi:hypothetical protein
VEKSMVVMDAPHGAKGIEDLGEENTYFLGAFGEVIGALKAAFPQGDFSDPTRITAETGIGLMRIEIAKHTPVQSFMVYYEKEEDVKLIQALCKRTGWRVLDTETGRFIDEQAVQEYKKALGTKKSPWRFWEK